MNTFIKVKVLGKVDNRFRCPIEMRVNVSDIKRYFFDPSDNKLKMTLSCTGYGNDAGIDIASYWVDSTIEEIDAAILSNNGRGAKILFGNKD